MVLNAVNVNWGGPLTTCSICSIWRQLTEHHLDQLKHVNTTTPLVFMYSTVIIHTVSWVFTSPYFLSKIVMSDESVYESSILSLPGIFPSLRMRFRDDHVDTSTDWILCSHEVGPCRGYVLQRFLGVCGSIY